MQIVIDIPEMAYNLLKSNETIDWLDAETILDRIVEGTVLPKGHGRLIDADAYVKRYNTNINGNVNGEYAFAPTIIPADKEND
jgi:hypothetical protein